MRMTKIVAIVLALCMLSCLFVACDDGNEAATEAGTVAAAEKIEVTIEIIHGGSTVVTDKETVEAGKTLADVLALYCAGIDYEGDIFDANGIMTTIGIEGGEPLTGNWTAYYKDKGQTDGKIASIMNEVMTGACTIVLTCK